MNWWRDFMHRRVKRKNYLSPIILKKVFSNDEINQIIKTLSQEKLSNNENQYIPYKYIEIDWQNPQKNYIQQQSFLSQYQEVLIKPLIDRVNTLQNKIKVQAILQKEHEPFNVVTIRVLQPGKVDIHFHCDNEFTLRVKDFSDKISRQIVTKDYLSLVLMIQEPEEGGEIIIYDEYWKSLQENEAQYIALGNLPENSEKVMQRIKLDAGDVVIFEAGRTWHKVNEVYGSKARITAGGFLGKCIDNSSQWKLWS